MPILQSLGWQGRQGLRFERHKARYGRALGVMKWDCARQESTLARITRFICKVEITTSAVADVVKGMTRLSKY
jgi:hypothetical protein